MNEPLAQRLRPKTLADVCGQQHLLAPGRVFRRTIESGRIPNMIFYGPSGTGKTTVARIIAENLGDRRDKKVLVFKRKAKKGFKKLIGHRQTYTWLKIQKIEGEG